MVYVMKNYASYMDRKTAGKTTPALPITCTWPSWDSRALHFDVTAATTLWLEAVSFWCSKHSCLGKGSQLSFPEPTAIGLFTLGLFLPIAGYRWVTAGFGASWRRCQGTPWCLPLQFRLSVGVPRGWVLTANPGHFPTLFVAAVIIIILT